MGRATRQGGAWGRGPQSHNGKELNAAVSHRSSEEELEPGEVPTPTDTVIAFWGPAEPA